ncbi:MAG TPA: apolipoprotein N-acyltransferase [Thermodesulfobacteriaceae bacterium]|nr:apolipoprotein N-acyltransferase [Thermodesulfobacteriaceae bacterium]
MFNKTDSPEEVLYLLSLLSGLLLTLAFPPWSLWPLIGIALVPLMYASCRKPLNQAFRLGFLTGLVYFGTLLWWIAPTISQYGDLPIWASWPVLGLLACYLAVYPAVWTACFGWLTGRTCSIGVQVGLAGLWTLLEWCRGHFLSGMPWGMAAYCLEPVPALIQTAEYFGPYGLSFVIILFNMVIFRAVVPDSSGRIRGSTGFGLRRYMPPVLFCLCILVLWAHGKRQMENIAGENGHLPGLRVAAVQGSIPQDVKWNPAYQGRTLEIYRHLSGNAVKKMDQAASPADGHSSDRPVLVVWPETAAPFYFQNPGPLRDSVTALATDLGVSLLFGSLSYQMNSQGSMDYLNSAYLVDPAGRVISRYDKRHLVPFGEYMPWGWITAWARELLPSAGQCKPGLDPGPLKCDGVRIGVLICFESIFPELAREAVQEGANILAVITNDAWFGRTGAPYQHEAMAVFRAVETRRWIVRAANTGISSIITPWGTRIACTGLFVPSHIYGTAYLRENTTFFAGNGEYWFLLLCIFVTILPYWVILRKKA